MIKAVFLDFDGTVSDAKSIAFKSFVMTLEELGYEFDGKKVMDLLGTKMEGMLTELGLGHKDVNKVRKKFYGYFIKAALSGGIRPCVSLKPLWKMKEEGLPLFVVSHSRTSFLRASIKELGIKGLFNHIYGSEKFESKDEMLRSLFKKFKFKPSEAIYIGDRFSDIEFAREAGCVAVAIHNKCSWSTLERIKEEKPDYVVRDFYGLRKVIRKINSSR
jgi:phosphoglycolate phosphatase